MDFDTRQKLRDAIERPPSPAELAFPNMTYRAVWRSAHQLLLDHCDNASLEAALNADRTLAEGRDDNYRFGLP
jgi:hypothetical protein